MATTDLSSKRHISYWQQGCNDARSGLPRDLSSVPTTNDGWANTCARRGYSNGYSYGMAVKNNENSK